MTSTSVVATPFGFIGVAVGERGLSRVALGERTRKQALERLGAREESPSPEARALAARLGRWAQGARDSFEDVAVDVREATEFERTVFDATRAVRHGTTTTYGEIARRIGRPGAARAVGAALGRNPVAVVVPCHRVVASGGSLRGFSAPGGVGLKRKLLELEAGSAR